MSIEDILDKNSTNLALIIGNGINQYNNPGNDANSWTKLLMKIGKVHSADDASEPPDGISNTEFYDVIELKSKMSDPTNSLQKKFCSLLSKWKPFDHHITIMAWAVKHRCPVLTTNFDGVMAAACGARPIHLTTDGFIDYYPWSTYYGIEPVKEPSQAFGIWHVNGMAKYPRSIRLGLGHYMGSVQRLRGWLHRGGGERLFASENALKRWNGRRTWLDAFFNNDLLIVGLGLNENEVFLRWSLIERARYFNKFPSRKRKAWYVDKDDLSNTGKAFFLEGVGVEIVKVSDFDEIYCSPSWLTTER